MQVSWARIAGLFVCLVVLGEARAAKRISRTTESGAGFKSVSTEALRLAGIKFPTLFGTAWEDPDGVIWSDIAKNSNGSAKFMKHPDAESYCASLGATLPSGYSEEKNGMHGFPNRDSDFVRLRKFLGAQCVDGFDLPKGYSAQILPNLDHWHWSSSLDPNQQDFAYEFHGRFGTVDHDFRFYLNKSAVRCVVRAACSN